MSYRKALNLVATTETTLGKAVVRKAQGKGVEFSPLGQAIVRLDDQLVKAVALTLESRPAELETLYRFLVQLKPRQLRLYLSHDIFLMRVVEALPSGLHQALEIKFDGSLNALRQFARGECEVAGFHLPTGKLGQSVGVEMRPYLEQPGVLVQPLLKRVQGLMFRQDSVLSIQRVMRPP
jgi:hypothetical protein